MNETAATEYFGEIERARAELRAATRQLAGYRDNNANQARSVDLRDEDNIATLALLWETSHAYGRANDLVKPILGILDQLDAFRAGYIHGEPDEHPMKKRAEHLETLIAQAADDAELAADPKYDTTEGILAYFVQQVRARKNLSNAIKGAADDMGYGEVKSVEAFVRESREKLAATRQRADKERAALEKIAGMLGLEVKPGAAADEFVEAVRRRTHETVNPAQPDLRIIPGDIIAGIWSGAPTDTDKIYVGSFLRKSNYDTVSIERPVLETGDEEQDSYWRIVVTDLKRHTVRKATAEEANEYLAQMDNLG